MKKISIALTAIGILFIVSAGGTYVLLSMVFMEYGHLAIPAAAILAALGAAVLIVNSIIYPESISRPNVQPPVININLPPEIGGYSRLHTTYTSTASKSKIPGFINLNEWPIVSAWQGSGSPLTKRQRIRGMLCCLLWIAALIAFFIMSYITTKWTVTWIIFLGTAFIHILIYGLFSIGEKE
jgi:hypothetical protein